MSKGLQPQSVRGQIRGIMPDLPIREVKRLAYHLSAKRLPVTVTALLALLADPTYREGTRQAEEPRDAAEALGPGDAPRSTLWREAAGQSPRVDCPARGCVTLSTCHDDYTDAASGHKRGPVECGRCVVGRQRRADLARSVWAP